MFEAQLALAAELTRPVVIHSREAIADTLAMMARFAAVRGVFHCFTGTADEAAAIADRGWRISFTGIVTFPKSDELQRIASEYPADKLMVETDSPYLAPGKFRGKRNEPSYVVEVAKVLAETRRVSLEEISRQTTENFFRLFSKVPAPKATI